MKETTVLASYSKEDLLEVVVNDQRAVASSRIPQRASILHLGRHLLRSMLRICAPAELIEDWLGQSFSRERAHEIALDRVAAADPRVKDLQAMIDALHAATLISCATLNDSLDLEKHWDFCMNRHASPGRELAGAYWMLLTHPGATRQLRHTAFGDMEMLYPDPARLAPLAIMTGRRSPSPRRLSHPGPNELDIERMVEAALSAPDHGMLRPWRTIVLPLAERPALADLFEQEKLRRMPSAARADLDRSREHALTPPCLVAFVVTLHGGPIPAHEQWLAAGAALGNFLNAAHALGFPAVVRSGDRCADRILCEALGLKEHEVLGGFVGMGSALSATSLVRHVIPDGSLSTWHG